MAKRKRAQALALKQSRERRAGTYIPRPPKGRYSEAATKRALKDLDARQQAKRRASGKRRGKTRWSQHVTHTSNALDLRPGIFTSSDPKRIAKSLKRSAEDSRRRKAEPFQSAMSMLTFYLNRAGRGLSGKQRRVLSEAKVELRRIFGRSE